MTVDNSKLFFFVAKPDVVFNVSNGDNDTSVRVADWI